MSALEERRQWADQVAAEVDPDRLVARLREAGWEVAGGRSGVYARLYWPGDAETLVVPLDRAMGDYVDLMAAVLVELDWTAERGVAAQQVLEQLAHGHI